MVGTLRITRSGAKGGKELEVSCITDIDISFSKRVSVTPIVSKGMDSTFPLENGSNMSISFSFTRKNPDVVDNDSDNQALWSNSRWYDMLTSMVNVWQLKSNGYIFQYNEMTDESYLSNTPTIYERGYIKKVSRKYNSKHNTILTGTIDVSVGTAYVETERPTADEKYAFDINYVMNPGDLGENEVFLSNGASTEVDLKDVYSKALIDIKLTPSVEFVGDGWDTITICAPYPPTIWNTLADMGRVHFIGWDHNGTTYLAGDSISVSKGNTTDNILVAKWAVNDDQ